MSNTANIIIDENKPFINDKLNRKQIADNLALILKNRNDSFVLSIDSGWGTGKTTFIEMWAKQLKNQGEMIPIYFNAWENDDFDDPLLAIISQLIESEGTKKENNEIIDKIKQYSIPIMKSTLLNVVNKATFGCIDKDTLEDIYDSGIKGPDIFDKFNEYTTNKTELVKVLERFREAQQDKKIIFFIDELDRCRPMFAIETLERIKHFFNIPGYIFVLSVDREQLSHSIATLYGQNMDSQGYLRRFIDLEYRLPEPDFDLYVNYMIEKNNYISKKSENLKYFWPITKALFQEFHFSLRDVNKYFNHLYLFLPISDMMNFEKHRTSSGVYGDTIRLYIVSLLSAYLLTLRHLKATEYKWFKDRLFTVLGQTSQSTEEEKTRIRNLNLKTLKFKTEAVVIDEQASVFIDKFYNLIKEPEVFTNREFKLKIEPTEYNISLSFLLNCNQSNPEARIFDQIEFAENFNSYDMNILKSEGK
jgi:hypothetical protein